MKVTRRSVSRCNPQRLKTNWKPNSSLRERNSKLSWSKSFSTGLAKLTFSGSVLTQAANSTYGTRFQSIYYAFKCVNWRMTADRKMTSQWMCDTVWFLNSQGITTMHVTAIIKLYFFSLSPFSQWRVVLLRHAASEVRVNVFLISLASLFPRILSTLQNQIRRPWHKAVEYGRRQTCHMITHPNQIMCTLDNRPSVSSWGLSQL